MSSIFIEWTPYLGTPCVILINKGAPTLLSNIKKIIKNTWCWINFLPIFLKKLIHNAITRIK